MITTHAKRFALSTAILAACAAGSAPAEDADVHKALAPCIGMSNSADRLACYDKLAGRVSEPKARPSAAAVTPAPAAAPVAAAPAPAAAPTEEDFGRSKVQKAAISGAPPEIKSVTSKVAGFGRSPNLHTQITLDNGQIWEYEDDPDPLLSIGDSVTIKHGTLGSFLLLTPTKLSHRVRRIN
ncbi:MAG TPA: hypothetical protein VGI32_05905 [Steroidobacteraceae bacterium]